jgi:septal ring factor EnvC (AmiA/AmiB activator)
VERAADALLRSGERPTIEKIRGALGSGSPNTINPLLDAWWKRLSARLDSGPAALHRLPEPVAHVAEALWMQALEEGRRRAQSELHTSARASDEQKQTLDVRSHVLTLREGELDSRLRDRQNTITELNLQLRELTLLLRKEQGTRYILEKRITTLEAELLSLRPPARPARREARTKPKAANTKSKASASPPHSRKALRRKKTKPGRRR